MCSAIGHPVQRLVRTRIGPVRDPNLPPGQWRTLEAGEVRALAAAAGPGGRGAATQSVGIALHLGLRPMPVE